MKKSKLILSSLLALFTGACIVGGVFSAVPTRSVYALVNDDGTIDLGMYNETATQENTETYSTLITKELYVADDSAATKALYTVRITNLTDIDVGSATGYTESFGKEISVQMIAASNSSNRLPWLSHSFKLSDNLLQASKNGWLDVSVSANAKINTEKDGLKSVLYNGQLTGVADITSYDKDIQSISKSSTAVDQTLSLSGAQYSDFMVVWAMNRIDSGMWRTIKMTITNPTLCISSKDTSAPVVEFSADKNWSSNDKTLTVKVTDSQSGIMSVTSSSELTLVSETDNTQEKEYSINMAENGEYSITVVDNVGNSHTYTYTESKIDKTKPGALSISMPSLSYVPNISISATFVSDNLSPESIHYTLDGTTPTADSPILVSNTLTIPYGEYVFQAVVVDEAGHMGEVYSQTIKVDRRTLDIMTHRCACTVSKPTTLDTDIGYQFYDGETIRLDFVANENCSRKVIRVNGVESELSQDYYEFIANGDAEIEVVYVYDLALTPLVTTYQYNPNIDAVTPSYSLNTDEDLDLAITITRDGQIAVAKNAGTYHLSWNYDSDEFRGSGSYDFEIKKVNVSIEVEEGQSKTYGDSDPTMFEYTVTGLPADFELNLQLGRVAGEDVGSYEIKMISSNLDDNYQVSYESQNFTIKTKKVIVVANCLTKTYGDSDPELSYKLYESSLIDGDSLLGELKREDGEDVGSYEIGIGSLKNSNYEILFRSGTMQILPKEISISIDDRTTTYGKEKDLTFTISEDVDMQQITGSLSRTSGNDVGVYSIGLGSLSSTNYNITITKLGSYKIEPRLVTVSALPASKVYGEADDLQYEVSGLCEGDLLYGDLSRNPGESVASYEINLGTLHNKNYTINFESNYLTILPAGLSITISDLTQVYGEIDKEFEYTIEGLKFNDLVACQLYREAGDDVGTYVISCMDIEDPNYYVKQINTGVYMITKATIVPTITKTRFTYSGNVNYVDVKFPFEVSCIYKQNGIECDGALNAGTYQVQAIFAGNNNYNASKSAVVDVVVNKQRVYLTLADNKFIYDGNVKFPEFSYDTSCGLDINKVSFNFENDVRPTEVGSYNFTIVTTDDNYEIDANGVLLIENSWAAINDNGNTIECEEATFDESAKNIKLVETHVAGDFNGKKLISSCTFDNVTTDNNYVYTVRIKATSDSKNIYAYQLGEDESVREIVVTNDNGYWVFKVDNLNCTYLISRDIEYLPFWFWLALVWGIAIGLVVTLIIIRHSKKAKIAKFECTY